MISQIEEGVQREGLLFRRINLRDLWSFKGGGGSTNHK